MSGLLDAVSDGDLPRVQHLLACGANIAEKDRHGMGYTPLLVALLAGNYAMARWLIEVGGASLTDGYDQTVWHEFSERHWCGTNYFLELDDETELELSLLLKVMVMLCDAPPECMNGLSPQNAEIVKRGKQLRVQLPTYLQEQHVSVVVSCPLPVVLQSIVVAYATTTAEDMWGNGLQF
jgi:hypothetical protein